MSKYKFVAYYSANNDIEEFESFKQAEEWLNEIHDDDGYNDGFAEETIDGQDFIAKITHRSHFNILKRKEDYIWNKEAHGYFLNGDPEDEEWGGEFDTIGEIVMKEET